MHLLAYGEFMGENWEAFCPSCKGRVPPNLQPEKNGQHSVLLLYKIPPQKPTAA